MRQNTKVATKAPRVIWLPRSCRKLVISRGPNWFVAWETVAMVIEKVTPATVTIDDAIACRIARAPSGSLNSSQPRPGGQASSQVRSIQTPRRARAAATALISPGMNQ